MFTGIYQIAGIRIEITSVYPDVQNLCSGYQSAGPAELFIQTSREDIEQEQIHVSREKQLEGLPDRVYTEGFLETLAVYRKIAERMIFRNTLLFHGSAIAVDGAGYLFTAVSGTGKSTHTRLWREYFGDRAEMVNDDKPLLRFAESGILLCGTPWSGIYHLDQNISVPLKAICILERGNENAALQILPREAIPMLLQQSHRPSDPAAYPLYLTMMEQLIKQVPLYRMQCTISPQAVQVAYEKMNEKGSQP